MDRGVPDLLAAALRPARTHLTSTNHPSDTEGGPPRRGRSRCAPGHTGNPAHHTAQKRNGHDDQKQKHSTISNRPSACLND